MLDLFFFFPFLEEYSILLLDGGSVECVARLDFNFALSSINIQIMAENVARSPINKKIKKKELPGKRGDPCS